MEPPSALPRGGRVPWQELLLAVSLLTFWNPPTTAQVTVELVPPNAAEGKDVLLRVHNLPVNLLGFGWFKGETVEPRSEIVSYAADSQEITPGLAHSGRETLYHNGSLLFQNINLEDTGYYTVRILKRNFQIEIVTRRLRVYQAVSQPSINISNTTATEHKDSVVLTCSTNNKKVSIRWFFNGRNVNLTKRMKLSRDNRALTISLVRVEDAGNYQCEVSNRASSNRSDPISPTGLPVGTNVGIAIGVLVGGALVAALGYLLVRVKTGRASGQRNHREMGHPACTPGEYPFSPGSTGSPSTFPQCPLLPVTPWGL
uniref:Ig-like domain-containing protein n=1 Tax=Panthera tigris altaica TaxID=74533 RepID=A0A8C9K9B1_PANTA